jgi:hypothetical protein
MDEDGMRCDDREFWNVSIKYVMAVLNDESFVKEIAYIMVTLHKTGC